MPFLKFCPKPKRALRISSPYLAEPVQKAYQRVFASMELLKNRVNILSKRIKQLSSKFSMFTCKKHFRYNLFQVASKVLNKHGGTGQIWTGEWRFCRPLPYHLATVPYEIRNAPRSLSFSGAGDEARTRYLHLGKVALYRMSYARIWCRPSESNRFDP